MESVENNTTTSNQDIAATTTTSTISKYCAWYTQFRNVSNPWMARYAYALIFLMANMLAWAARDELPTLGVLLEMKDCLLNLFLITGTLILIQIMTSVSLHSKVNAGILSPGLIGLYTVYLCWSAMRSSATLGNKNIKNIILLTLKRSIENKRNRDSEPEEYSCILKSDFATRTDWQSIISFVVAILAIVIATFSTGIDSKCLQFRKNSTPAEDDVPYGYGFFHAVFATGAMYFAMLLNGWSSNHSMKKYGAYHVMSFLL
ncbi:unnamed protein product [Lupinus luteus]|uniref:Serine incorporator n=1 Tax=Lupinus luteus TaxID=3873 RepID=A0AAV1XM21_LUPLU